MAIGFCHPDREAVLRDYQNQALDAWVANGNRGIIVLPTGSGKTPVGIKANSLLNTPALVVAPTLDLVDQWRTRLKKELWTEVGVLGGGEWDKKALTVSNYDSAYIHADKQKPSRLPEAGYEERQRSGRQNGTSCQEWVKWSGLDPENAEILKI